MPLRVAFWNVQGMSLDTPNSPKIDIFSRWLSMQANALPLNQRLDLLFIEEFSQPLTRGGLNNDFRTALVNNGFNPEPIADSVQLYNTHTSAQGKKRKGVEQKFVDKKARKEGHQATSERVVATGVAPGKGVAAFGRNNGPWRYSAHIAGARTDPPQTRIAVTVNVFGQQQNFRCRVVGVHANASNSNTGTLRLGQEKIEQAGTRPVYIGGDFNRNILTVPYRTQGIASPVFPSNWNNAPLTFTKWNEYNASQQDTQGIAQELKITHINKTIKRSTYGVIDYILTASQQLKPNWAQPQPLSMCATQNTAQSRTNSMMLVRDILGAFDHFPVVYRINI